MCQNVALGVSIVNNAVDVVSNKFYLKILTSSTKEEVKELPKKN